MDDVRLTRIVIDICESRQLGEGELDRDRVLADMDWLVTQIHNLQDQTEARAKNLRVKAQRIVELKIEETRRTRATREKNERIGILERMNDEQRRIIQVDEKRIAALELGTALDKAKKHIAKVETTGRTRYATICRLQGQLAGLQNLLDRERRDARARNPHSTV